MQSTPARMHAVDACIAVCVRGDPDAGAMGFVDDRCELFVRVLLRAREPAVRHHAAGRRDLDQPCAVLDLVTHRFAHLGHAVRDAFLDSELEDVGAEPLEHRGIEVSAGGRDRVTGRHDPRAVDPPVVDRTRERDVEQVATGLDEQTEVADRREPGFQRPAAVHDRAECSERGIVLDVAAAVPAVRSAQQHVDLHVHQPGQQRDVAQVDLPRAVGNGVGVDRGDAISFDDDRGGLAHLARVDVDPPVRPQNGLLDLRLSHGRGSMMRSRYAAPLSGTCGWRQASTGNDAMTSE